MKNTKNILLLLTILFVTACGPAIDSIYNAEKPLLSHRVFSRSNELSVKIPVGWYAAEENESNLFDIWLIKNDYSAMMSINPIHLDETLKKELKTEGVSRLIEFSEYFKRLSNKSDKSNFKNEEYFEVNNKRFAAYEWLGGNEPERVVVFSHGDISFEFSAVCKKTDLCDSLSVKELFETQNSVLQSIK